MTRIRVRVSAHDSLAHELARWRHVPRGLGPEVQAIVGDAEVEGQHALVDAAVVLEPWRSTLMNERPTMPRATVSRVSLDVR